MMQFQGPAGLAPAFVKAAKTGGSASSIPYSLRVYGLALTRYSLLLSPHFSKMENPKTGKSALLYRLFMAVLKTHSRSLRLRQAHCNEDSDDPLPTWEDIQEKVSSKYFLTFKLGLDYSSAHVCMLSSNFTQAA